MENKYDEFVLHRWEMDRIWKVAKRLYTEQRMNGDEMRNAAQELQAMLENGMSDSKRWEIPNEM